MKKSYTLNETYFDNIDCDAKAYWLGFLFADGSITNTNTIAFGQSSERFDMVKKFASAIKYDG